MKIEDEELRGIFQAEGSESLEKLEQGLLALEARPDDSELIESVFRAAHSLKGSAGMLGVSSIELLAHQFEDILDLARRGRSPLTSAVADQLYQALDSMRALLDEAITGKPSGIDLRALLESLRAPKVAGTAPAPLETPAPRGDLNAHTIRVETQRLDRLLEKVGDLVVTTARAALRQTEVEKLRELLEQWQREWRIGSSGSATEENARRRDGLRLAQLSEALEVVARNLEDDRARLAGITEQLRDEIQEIRLLPLTGTFNLFPRLVRDLAQQEGKEIRLFLEGGETTADRRLLEKLKEPLIHLMRNAIDHGVERPERRRAAGKSSHASIWLRASRQAAMLQLELSDDGAGLDLAAISRRALEQQLRTPEQLARASAGEISSLIFAPGFSTRTEISDLSGRGTGLDAVRTSVEALNGTVELESRPGQGTTFRLRVPLTVSTTPVMICREGGHLYALPLASVERTVDLHSAEQDLPLPLSSLALILGHPDQPGARSCVILHEQNRRCGFISGQLVGVMELVVKPLHESPLVSGASILPEGSICLLLNPGELLQRSREHAFSVSLRKEAVTPGKRILLVEDSPITPNFEHKILEAAGYSVHLTRDGQEAWERLQSEAFDAVVSDIEMPHLSGLELTRRLRGLSRYREVPVILITALASDTERQGGLEAGASAYLSKSSVESGSLVRYLERLL
ncbi:MAG: hybrid sensor histidine kinase/response regulator [Candidatus Eremiobacteraeota bacterium]|nr:hybrid sensor histidine kinase/response regulator [Candidatus Eremiobacteraeota bacterium]MCW5868126.1 hybrid sensor histidine kinase/response regulator [Candidatus Eremiobacteraeota bacterium]